MKLEEAISRILGREQRFAPEAYFLVRDALDFTVARLAEENRGESRHVSGPELVYGFRDFVLQEFGPMGATLLDDWSLTKSLDVGDIVFQFIEEGIFGKQDSDQREDFADVIDFQETFRDAFAPAHDEEVEEKAS